MLPPGFSAGAAFPRRTSPLVIGAIKGQPSPRFGVQSLMHERTVNHSDTNDLPAPDRLARQARHPFPRILTTATMALVLGIAMPGCHGASGQNGSSTSGDPADVNAAAAQSSCPAGQVLMSDGSCAADSQTQPAAEAPPQEQAPAAGARPDLSNTAGECASAAGPELPTTGRPAPAVRGPGAACRQWQLRPERLRHPKPVRQPDLPAGRLQRWLPARL